MLAALTLAIPLGAPACPLVVENFNVTGYGMPRGLVRYAVIVHADPGGEPLAAQLRVNSRRHIEPETVWIPVINFQPSQHRASVVFYWPNQDPSWIWVDHVVRFRDGSTVQCDENPFALQYVSTTQFDDSKVVTANPVIGHSSYSPGITSIVSPTPPASDSVTGVVGTVVLRISVLGVEHPRSIVVVRSSGEKALDDAAKAAAAASVFSSLEIDGVPVTGEYTLTYRFAGAKTSVDMRPEGILNDDA